MFTSLLLLVAFQVPPDSVPASTGSLRAWLDEEAMGQLDRRGQEMAKIASSQSAEARAAYVRRNLPLRPISSHGPLNAKVTKRIDRDTYTIENLTFESLPGFTVSANLYLPKERKGRVPAILGVAGHTANGKASATYQKAWIAFVRQGWAVLAYDPPGQGERWEYFDPASGTSRVGPGVPEHQMAGLQCFLTGRNLADYFVTDGVRAVDYLLTRPEIDPERIGVAGNSGGGTQAAYLTAVEPRLRAAVSSCYMTSWRQLWHDPGPQDAEQILPGMLARGLDFADFAYAFPRRPFLLTAAIQDFFPIAGARAAFAEMQRIGAALDQPTRAGYFEFDDKHGWSQPRREAAVRWFAKWFDGRETDGREAASVSEEESTLYSSPSGQVGGRTVADLNRDYLRQLQRQWTTPARERLLARLNMPPDGQPESLVAHPATSSSNVVIVAVTAQTGSPDVAELRNLGHAVIDVAPRGAAIFRSSARQGSYTADYQLAARAWVLGYNLPGIQTADLKSVIAEHARSGKRVWLYAAGPFVPAAIFTAALEPKVERLALLNGIRSYGEVVEATLHSRQAMAIVPGILEEFDLPQVLRLSKAQVTEIAPLTPNGVPIRSGGVRLRGEDWPLKKVLPEWFTQ
jgi:hypothetical protein